MPAIARAAGTDTVYSPDGFGKKCRFPITTATGAPTVTKVKIQGQFVVVEGDVVGVHNRTGCVPDTQTLSTYSSKVFIGGKAVGRINDNYGDNIITSGCPTVFAG